MTFSISTILLFQIVPSYGQIDSSPREQVKSGVPPLSIKCNGDLQLLIKTHDWSPSCVKPDAIGRLVSQGWWIWNAKVGSFETNNVNKKPFDQTCAVFPPSISIAGSDGFLMNNLPENKTYTDYGKLPMFEFVLPPDSTGHIIMIYDFNSFHDNPCNFTWQNGLDAYGLNMSTAFTPIHFFSTNQTGFTPLDDVQKIYVQAKILNTTSLNDHAIQVIYQITSSSTNGSYLAVFHFNCPGTLFTVGYSLHPHVFDWENKNLAC